MATFEALLHKSDAPAILLPPSSTGSKGLHTISYTALSAAVDDLRTQLGALGFLDVQDAVSMSLINSYEFVVAFIATGLHRRIAAPLNPAYNSAELSFYLDDVRSKLLIVHKGAIKDNSQAVQAARKHNIKIAEIWFDVKKGKVGLSLEGASSAAKPKSKGGPFAIA